MVMKLPFATVPLQEWKVSVNFQPFFDWMNLPPSCTTWLPQVSGWCSVAWNKQIEKGTLWHLTLARMQLTASLPASYNNDRCLLAKEWERERGGGVEGREERGQREVEEMVRKDGNMLVLWNPGRGGPWSEPAAAKNRFNAKPQKGATACRLEKYK